MTDAPATRQTPTRPIGAALLQSLLQSLLLLLPALLAAAAPDAAAPGVSGEASTPGLELKVLAEVQTQTTEKGRRVARLQPADRVVPGDTVIYTLKVQTPGPTPGHEATIGNPGPEHLRYLANSASGPSARITYSADGGPRFEVADRLTLPGPNGPRKARAADYTHLRWRLANPLKVNSVAYLRFRALVTE